MLKSNIAWMKKNVPSDLKVWKGMIQDIDWSQVAAKTKLSLQRDKDRITAEFKEFAAMDTSAKIDWLMNGDRHLGYLYKKDAIAFARREWKGLKSVGYDFVGWLKIWGGMLNMVMKDPMSIMLAVFEYHWFASYLATPAVVDRSVFGRRGKLLQADFDMWVAITHWAEDLIANLIMADAKIGGNQKINKRIIMFDEMTMAQMMAGFPNLLGIPYQMIPVFMVSEMDQLTLIPYIDAIESYGLPSDTCPLPTAECGCAVKDEYPMCGQGFIASSMPCDGSVMATSFQDRRFSKFMPSYPLCMPVRYDDEDTTEMAAADMKDCIHWVEGLTGETWNWDTYFATMEKMNECTRLEMEKWEINKTHYPQLVGSSFELFRKWNYEMDGGLFPEGLKTQRKICKTMMETYEKKLPAYVGGYEKLPCAHLELPGPLLRQLLQLAGQLLGHLRADRDGSAEYDQDAQHHRQGRGHQRPLPSVRAHGHASPHQRRPRSRSGRAVETVRELQRERRHYVSARLLQDDGRPAGPVRRSGS